MDNALFTPKLSKDGRPFRYSVLTGVETACVFRTEIRGRFASSLTERFGEPSNRLVASFVNWPNRPEDVLRFTLQNGPIDDKPEPGEAFVLPVERFRTVQDELRALWRQPIDLLEAGVHAGQIRFRGPSITYVARDFRSFLIFDLMTAPSNRLKVCGRAGCPHPHFVAGDLKRRFCSLECRDENRREAKRKSWREKAHSAATGGH